MSVKETLKQLESEKTKVLMAELYGAEKAEENRARYRYVAERFEKTYGERDIKLFTSPGRTEISGNHTDHNHGKVLAGSINLDCVGAAFKRPETEHGYERHHRPDEGHFKGL